MPDEKVLQFVVVVILCRAAAARHVVVVAIVSERQYQARIQVGNLVHATHRAGRIKRNVGRAVCTLEDCNVGQERDSLARRAALLEALQSH